MSYQMKMPKMGENINEATIIKWHKKIGDIIEKDEILLEISTDKVDSEIPSPVSGKIAKIIAKEGDTVLIGKVIAQIEAGETSKQKTATELVIKKSAVKKEEVILPPKTEGEKQPVSQTDEEMQTEKEPRLYSPLVLNMARIEGISKEELAQIKGGGIQGRVTKKDLLDYLKKGTAAKNISEHPSQPAPIQEGTETIPMDHIRKKIAEHMVKTVHTSPHVGLYIEVDMSRVVAVREKNKNRFYQNEGFSLTYMPFIVESVVKSLKEFPLVNASIIGDNIIVKHFIHMGIAVATDQGLIVPVVKNAESLNIIGLARAIHDLANRARSKKLKPDEVTGGTFSLSNFGVYGTTLGFPLINQPQVAILGIGILEKRAIVINDAIAIHPMMNLALVFDHRLIDGSLGAQFLKRVSEHLQEYDPEMSL